MTEVTDPSFLINNGYRKSGSGVKLHPRLSNKRSLKAGIVLGVYVTVVIN